MKNLLPMRLLMFSKKDREKLRTAEEKKSILELSLVKIQELK